MTEFSRTMDAATIQRIVRRTIDWASSAPPKRWKAHRCTARTQRVLANFARAILFGEPLSTRRRWAKRRAAVQRDHPVRIGSATSAVRLRRGHFLAELNARIRAEGGYPERS